MEKNNKECIQLYNKSTKDGTEWSDIKNEKNITDNNPKISTKKKNTQQERLLETSR